MEVSDEWVRYAIVMWDEIAGELMCRSLATR